ncbi:MAG: transcriptional regulator PpsR [Pseudomonadota bacterium]
MDDRTGNTTEQGFSRLEGYLGELETNTLARLFGASSDLIMIVGPDGMIKDANFRSKEIFSGGGRAWTGRNFQEVVTRESELKIGELLKEAAEGVCHKAREVNHPMVDGEDIPVSYRAAKLNNGGDILVFGQSIAKVANLQRRLMSSQLSMEREVARLRGNEGRYRAIFHSSDMANIVVNPETLRIVDINLAASKLLDKPQHKLENTKILSLFQEDQVDVIHKLLLAMLKDKISREVSIEMPQGTVLIISGTLFRQDRQAYLLLTLNLEHGGSAASDLSASERKVLALIEQMPDAFIVTNAERHILQANSAFLELFNLTGPSEVVGVSIDSFFERPSVDCKVLLANVAEHGIVRRFATVMRGQFGQVENVEIAATQLKSLDDTVFGFWIRPTTNLILGSEGKQERVSRTNEQIANLVGHMPLKDIVRETTDMIEQLCIETALDLTHNNRASAAQMLGLSRQSLYSKLGRGKD